MPCDATARLPDRHEQRSSAHFRHACELAINGYLGQVHTICVGGGETCRPPCDPPAGFDYDLWSGPAPFSDKKLRMAGMYMISHYCAGFITNWGVHHLDIAGWGCPDVFDNTFEIQGTGVLPAEGMTDTWISWQMELRWESGLRMSYSTRFNPHQLGWFEGKEGWVHQSGRHLGQPASLLTLQLKPRDTLPALNSLIPTRHTADFFRGSHAPDRYRRSNPATRQYAGQYRRHRVAVGTQGNVDPCMTGLSPMMANTMLIVPPQSVGHGGMKSGDTEWAARHILALLFITSGVVPRSQSNAKRQGVG
jgi:hypothetical protein